MFLIRTAFFVAIVLLLLPIDRQAAGITEGPGTFETFAAIQTVVADARGFCDRNPQACATGAATVGVLRQKAIYSAGVVQSWLAEGEAGATISVHNRLPANGAQDSAGGDDQVAALIQAANGRVPASAFPPL